MAQNAVQQLGRRITDAVHAHTPGLLQRYGVGPDTAAALLLAADAALSTIVTFHGPHPAHLRVQGVQGVLRVGPATYRFHSITTVTALVSV